MIIFECNRKLSDPLSYTPKAGCGARSMNISRSDIALGESGLNPILMGDTSFWRAAEYGTIIEAVVASGSRNWTTVDPVKVTSGLPGVPKSSWETMRQGGYEKTIMIGALLAKLTYNGKTEFVVSAAPNVLYDAKKGYSNHLKGDNKGTQIHAEMIFAAQLQALIAAMRAADELPEGQFKPRKGLSAGVLTVDADMFIEKSSLCDGCQGTWKQFKAAHGEVVHRII